MCGKIFVQEKHPLETYAIVEFEKRLSRMLQFNSIYKYIHLCTQLVLLMIGRV